MKNAIKVFCFVLAIIVVGSVSGLVYFKWDTGEFNYVDGNDKGTVIITEYTGDSVNIVIPNRVRGKKVVSIDDSAFSGTDIVSLKTNDIMTSIGKNAFQDCTSLETVVIGKSVKSIGEGCFSNCKSLKTVTMSPSVEKLGNIIFGNDAALEDVNFDGNDNFKNVNGIIMSADSSVIYEALSYADLSDYDCPSDVKDIKAYAFYNHPELKHFKFNDSIKIINEGLFSKCSGLTEVSISSSVTEINSLSFSGTGLKTLEIPKNVIKINDSAFYGLEEQLTIITVSLSNAETFAKENNFNYKIVDTL